MKYRLVAIACGILAPGIGRAQTPRGLTLGDVVNAALRTSPAIQLARQTLESERGQLISASSPFDALIGTSASVAQTQQSALLTNGPTAYQTSSVVYAVTASKELHSGITVQPAVSVQRSAIRGTLVPANAADVSLTVAVPLLRNRGGSVSMAQLRAAEALYSAGEHAFRHSAAVGVFQAVSSYWNYLEAQRVLDIRVAAERRAELLVNEIRVLVAAEERAASDLNQALGNLASKRVDRIAAEQARDDAREALALQLDVGSSDTLLAMPAGDFPIPPATFLTDSTDEATFTAAALVHRADLERQRDIRHSAAISLAGAEAAARPGLALSVGVGYAGLQSTNGFGGFLSPLYRGIAGLNASIQIDYQLPLSNSVGKGAVLQQEATRRHADVEFASLQHEVMLDARLAARNTRRSARALSEAANAVARYRDVAASEKEKHRLGVNTLMEVILAEDALTNALMLDVETRTSYAVAIVTQRYATGTLIDASGDDLSVNVARLLTPE